MNKRIMLTDLEDIKTSLLYAYSCVPDDPCDSYHTHCAQIKDGIKNVLVKVSGLIEAIGE